MQCREAVALMSPGKPRHRDGYTSEELLQIRSTCLTVAVTLGAHLDQLCIVGGLVPNLLIDEQFGADPEADAEHPGTNDLDVAMKLALLDDQGYAEISTRLRQEGFGPDVNDRGNPTPQRWTLDGKNVFVGLGADRRRGRARRLLRACTRQGIATTRT